MAKSVPACEDKNSQNPATFSESEIEAARQLIQLSSGDSDTICNDEDHRSSNNSDSYSVQGKPQPSKVDTGGDDVSSGAAIEDVLADSEDESLARTNKRFRYIEDLYSVTAPLGPVIKA